LADTILFTTDWKEESLTEQRVDLHTLARGGSGMRPFCDVDSGATPVDEPADVVDDDGFLIFSLPLPLLDRDTTR
jgi:hypothetical protein